MRCRVFLISFIAACTSGDEQDIIEGFLCGAGAGGGGVNCTMSVSIKSVIMKYMR